MALYTKKLSMSDKRAAMRASVSGGFAALCLAAVFCLAFGTAMAGQDYIYDTDWPGTGVGVTLTGANSFTVDGAAEGEVDGDIGGAGWFTKLGTGTLVLSGDNTFTGGVTLANGTIEIGSAQALGTYTGPGSAGRVDVTGTGTGIAVDDNLTITNRFDVNYGASVQFDITSLKTLTIDGVNAGSSTGGALYVNTQNGLSFAAGSGNLVISNSSASSGGAAATQIGSGYSLDFTGLSSLTLTGNIANGSGGALYGDSVYLGANAVLEGNQSGYRGGAIYAQREINISGNTLFKDNLAKGAGGAIYLYYYSPNTITLDATGGSIAFTGNYQNVGNFSDPVGTGQSNAINTDGSYNLVLSGAGNIYFDDPIQESSTGTALTKSDAGFVQFRNANTYNGNVSVNGGEFRLAGDASLAASFSTSSGFSVASGAKLGGQGTVTANGGFTISGTLSPDGWRHEIPNDLTSTTVTSSGTAKGALTLQGNVTFAGAALDNLHLDTGFAPVTITGTISGSISEIKVANLEEGRYQLIAGDASTLTLPVLVGHGTEASILGLTTSGSQTITSVYLHGTATGLYLLINENLGFITWTGQNSDAWNATPIVNWKDEADAGVVFTAGDVVVFDSSDVTNRDPIVVGSGGVVAGGMKVTGGNDYTFSNGKITVDAATSSNQYADGRLTKTGAGTLIFNNQVAFAGGASLSGGTATFNAASEFGGAVTLNSTTAAFNAANEFASSITLNDSSITIGADQALGTYAYNSTNWLASTGQVIAASGDNTVISGKDNEISTRFAVRSGATLEFDIAAGTVLAISGVENIIKMNNFIEEYYTGGAIGAYGGLSFASGSGGLEIRDSTATMGGAIGARVFSGSVLDFSNLASLSLHDNEARYGGALIGHTVVLGAHTTISGNTAAQTGGALYIFGDLSIAGDSLFSGNSGLGGSGGAVYLDGQAADNFLSLNADVGDIAFTGNTASGVANSIGSSYNFATHIFGDRNVYFDDPVSVSNTYNNGNTTFVKDGNGFVQFRGANVFSRMDTSSSGRVDADVNAGEFRLAGGTPSNASFSVNGYFNVATGATLAGQGTITALGDFTIAGTLSPDGWRHWIPTTEETTDGTINLATGTSAKTGEAKGALTLTGNVEFQGAELRNITLEPDFVPITIQGTVASTSTIDVIDVANVQAGIYKIVEAAGGSYDTLTTVVKYNDQDITTLLSGRIENVEVRDVNGSIWLLLDTDESRDVIWTGGVSDVWDVGTAFNWREYGDGTMTPIKFLSGDVVAFDSSDTANRRDIEVADTGVTTGGMTVSGTGDYSFSGGKITASAAFSTSVSADGKLTKTSDGTLTFDNEVAFKGGAALSGGETTFNGASEFGGAVTLTDTSATFNGANEFGGAVTLTGTSATFNAANEFGGAVTLTGTSATFNGANEFGGAVTLTNTSATFNAANEFASTITLATSSVTIGADQALGAYAHNSTNWGQSAGLVRAVSGANTVAVSDDAAVSNRFYVYSGATLEFGIASLKTLTIDGVDAGLGDGGALYVGGANGLSFAAGSGNLVISNSSGANGGAVASEFMVPITLDFSGLASLYIHDNAAEWSGAIDGWSLVLGSHTIIADNSAERSGGGFYLFGDLTIAGDSLFSGNVAGTNGSASGGVVYFDGQNGNTNALNLNADVGDIAFTGNTARGVANSVGSGYNFTTHISGDRNVYFDDPVSVSDTDTNGNTTFVKDGDGFVQFRGANVFSRMDTSSSGRVDADVNAGEFRLAGGTPSDASFSVNGYFNVAIGATLAGQGTITALDDFNIAGTLSPDGYRYMIPTTDGEIDLVNGMSERVGQEKGRLDLIGNVVFNDVKLANITLETGHTPIAVTGSVTGGINSIDLANLATGSFDIVTATSGATAVLGTTTITRQGQTIVAGQRLSSVSASQTNGTVTVTVSGDVNREVIWTGADDGETWDFDNKENWKNNDNSYKTFLDGDIVTFNDTGTAHQNVILANTMTVGGMHVAVDGYVFSGGKLIGDATASNHIDANGRLYVDATATFNNEVEFLGGLDAENTAADKTLSFTNTASFGMVDVEGFAAVNFTTLNVANDMEFVGTTAMSITGTAVVGNDFSLDGVGSANLNAMEVGGEFSAAGSTVTLSGASVLTGGASFEGSTVILAAANALDNIDNFVDGTNKRGVAVFSGDSVLRAAANLTLDNALHVESETNPADGNSLTIESDGKALTLSEKSAVVLGDNAGVVFDAKAGDVITVNGAIDTELNTYAGQSLVKKGAGEVRLANDLATYAINGDTRLEAGTLRLATGVTLKTGTLFASGGTLAGTGKVDGSVRMGATSILSAGNSIGTLSITGDLSFEAGSFIDVEVNPADSTDADLVNVAGKATLTGATLRHIGLGVGGDYALDGREWTVLHADGGLEGTLSGYETDYFAFLDVSVRYENNTDVIMHLGRNSINFVDFAETPNQVAVALGLAGIGSGPLYDAITNLPATTDFPYLFDQLSGELHPSVAGMLQNHDRAFGRVLRNRAAVWDVCLPHYPIWASFDGSYMEADSRANTSRVKTTGVGVSVGGEFALGNRLLLGGAFRYADNDIKVNRLHSKAEVDSYQFALYGAWDILRTHDRALRLNFGASYGVHSTDSKRFIVEPSLAQKLEADYTAHSYQVFGDIGYTFGLSGNFSVEPYFGAAWNGVRMPHFTEKGGIAAIESKRKTNSNASTFLGFRAAYKPTDKSAIRFGADWQHVYGSKDPKAGVAFAGGNFFTVVGAPQTRNALGMNVSAEYQFNQHVGVEAGYEGLVGDHFQSHGGYFRLIFSF